MHSTVKKKNDKTNKIQIQLIKPVEPQYYTLHVQQQNQQLQY